MRDVKPLVKLTSLQRVSSNGTGERYYIRYVQTPSVRVNANLGDTPTHILGYSTADPQRLVVRMIDLEPFTPRKRKRGCSSEGEGEGEGEASVDSPKVGFAQEHRPNNARASKAVDIGDARGPSLPGATDALFNSLAHLEQTFRSDASKRHLLKAFDVPDQTPFGLALLGTAVFEPLFRTYLLLFQNRRAAFRRAVSGIKEELPALSLEELTSLENECQQLWRSVHASMLKKHDAS